MNSTKRLLASMIDYAGLFPPSRLPMAEAVANFAAYREHPQSWMLSRFVVPVARLDEFEEAADTVLPKGEGDEPWRLSALVGEDVAGEIDRIAQFNDEHASFEDGHAVVDWVELKGETSARIDAAAREMPEWLTPSFEIPIDCDCRGLIAAVAGVGHAKVRTGGVSAEAFPEAADLARFILTCAAAGVPFKATAGLHHPIRAEYRLTYEADAPMGPMYGFLNLFVAASMAKCSLLEQVEVEAILTERDAGAFVFSDAGVSWKDRRLTTEQLALARERFVLSMGSCSFTEPVEDLETLGLIES